MNNICNLCNFTGDRNLDLYYKVLYQSANKKFQLVLHCDTIAVESFISIDIEKQDDDGYWHTLDRVYLYYCPNCGRKLK